MFQFLYSKTYLPYSTYLKSTFGRRIVKVIKKLPVGVVRRDEF